jgi:hypothetical protein
MRIEPRIRTAVILGLVSVALLALPGCGAFKSKGKTPATMGERISVLDYERQVEAEAELRGVDVILPAAHVNAE